MRGGERGGGGLGRVGRRALVVLPPHGDGAWLAGMSPKGSSCACVRHVRARARTLWRAKYNGGNEQGFVSVSGDRRVLAAVQRLLRGTHIGEGGRDQWGARIPYTQLEVKHVWRMDNALMHEQYALEVCTALPRFPFDQNTKPHACTHIRTHACAR